MRSFECYADITSFEYFQNSEACPAHSRRLAAATRLLSRPITVLCSWSSSRFVTARFLCLGPGAASGSYALAPPCGSHLKQASQHCTQPKSKMPHSKIQKPSSQICDPKFHVPIPHSNSRIPHSIFHIPSPKVRNPLSQMQNLKSKIPNSSPKCRIHHPKSIIQRPII